MALYNQACFCLTELNIVRSLNEGSVLELALKDLAVWQDDLARAVQIVVQEVALVQSLSVDVPAEAVYLVSSVLGQHQLTFVERVVAQVHAPDQTLFFEVLSELHFGELLDVSNSEVLVELEFLLVDELDEVKSCALIHIHVEELAALCLVKYFVDRFIEYLLNHF